jgi:LDH2 family malate/lactate/ureidoglycolate dehydrogenase
VRVDADRLERFVTGVFLQLGLPEPDARVSARGLVLADLRGHESHGVSSNFFWYVEALRTGEINPRPDIRIVQDSAAITRWDGDLGHGFVVGERVMRDVIRRADQYGCAFASVGRSRHYGMAQYYSLMALDHDQIGFSMTNSHGAGVVPFAGAEARYETNPLTIAAPAGSEAPFVLDMATSTAAAGKIGVAARNGTAIPPTWAMGTDLRPTTDPNDALAALKLLPLGATREGGGHKGSGLALWVDIMCGALSMRGFHGATDDPGEVNHFFGAWKIAAFGPIDRYRELMDNRLRAIRETPPAPGYERVMHAGQPEWESQRDREANGIPLHPSVVEKLRALGSETGVDAPA